MNQYLRELELEREVRREARAEALKEGREEGRKEGRKEGMALTLEIIRLYNSGVGIEDITQKLNVSIEDVETVVKQL